MHRGSPSTPPVVLPIPLATFLPLLLLPPLPPFPWALPTVDARPCLLSCASSSCHLTMIRSAASRTPRYHFPPAFFSAVHHSAISTPNTKRGCSVDGIVDTDGSPSASPRVEVASGLAWRITSRRAGGSARIVKRPQSLQREGGARTNTLGTPAVAKLAEPGDPLYAGLSKWSPWCILYTPKKTKQFRFWSGPAVNLQARKKTSMIY